MKWFKHDTSSSRTEKLAMLKATRGLEGYGFYWNVLEIIAESAGKTGASASGSACFPLQTWCGLVGVPPQTFRKLAENCRDLGLFSVSFSKVSGVEVAKISTDALAEIADEYSSRKASRKKEQAEKLGECRDNVGTMSAVDKNRLDKNRTEENRKDENDLNTASAYAEVSADRSDGRTSRTEKLTCVSQRQNTAIRTETDGTAPMQLKGTEPVKPDNLCPNQPEVPDPTASAMGGPVGSVGLTASNADADDDDNVSDAADAEGGKKPASVPPCPHKDIVAIYHEVLPELRAVKVWNSTREKRLRARWREDKARQSLKWWRSYFESVRQSDFLMGRKTDWSADFDWLICPTNMAKVLEGRYHDGSAVSSLPKGMADRLESLFRDLASAWPADRIGDAKEAKRLFFAVFSPDVLADKERANMRLSNIEAWAQVVLGREAQYVPRLDRWLSGLDPDIAPADNGEREEVA